MVTYRTAGAWGAGYGAPLPAALIDANFYELQQAITAIGTNKGDRGIGVQGVAISGRTLIFTFSDGSTDTVRIPIMSWLWLENGWTPSTNMIPLSAFYVAGDGLYVVRVAHQSALIFNPEAMLDGEYVYLKMFSLPTFGTGQPQDVGGAYFGPISEDKRVFAFVAARAWSLPALAAGSKALLEVAPTATTYVYLKKITAAGVESSLSYIYWTAGVKAGIFGTVGVPVPATTFAIGDRLVAIAQTDEDATAADLVLTFKGALV